MNTTGNLPVSSTIRGNRITVEHGELGAVSAPTSDSSLSEEMVTEKNFALV